MHTYMYKLKGPLEHKLLASWRTAMAASAGLHAARAGSGEVGHPSWGRFGAPDLFWCQHGQNRFEVEIEEEGSQSE